MLLWIGSCVAVAGFQGGAPEERDGGRVPAGRRDDGGGGVRGGGGGDGGVRADGAGAAAGGGEEAALGADLARTGTRSGRRSARA